MYRFLSTKMLQWKERANRHPLILRGARQVGKTYLGRELAQSSFAHFIEVNFEADATLPSFFSSKDPAVICELLSAKYSVPVVDGQTLLFLDELQAGSSGTRCAPSSASAPSRRRTAATARATSTRSATGARWSRC